MTGCLTEFLTLAEVEKRHILAALLATARHQGKAAKLLGISAKTLYRKMREYGWTKGALPVDAPAMETETPAIP